MRILRLVSAHGARDLSLVDEGTGATVPDWVRIEPAPLERADGRWFARVFIHERDATGAFRHDDSDQPVLLVELVEVRIGTVWSV